ncbi:hypothetical protein ABHI18_004125 [Aspergillus niger]
MHLTKGSKEKEKDFETIWPLSRQGLEKTPRGPCSTAANKLLDQIKEAIAPREHSVYRRQPQIGNTLLINLCRDWLID